MIAQTTTTIPHSEISRREIKAHEPQTDRWPMPQAAMFIFSCASLCWVAIFAVSHAFLM